MIELKSKTEIELIRQACEIVARVIEALKRHIKPGVTTEELGRKARDFIANWGGIPAFKGYRGFPGYICTSINEEVVHGIPGQRKLKSGDIISLDVGVKLNGYFGDGAITLPVGNVSREAKKLIKVTEEALYVGIRQALPGNRLSNLSCAIQRYVESRGFSVVRQFVGHGIGSRIHEEPQIPNFGSPGSGPRLKRGMTLAIEPMVNMGTYEVEVLGNGWTAVTRDRRLSAHFEHTISVTDRGPQILTKIPSAFAKATADSPPKL